MRTCSTSRPFDPSNLRRVPVATYSTVNGIGAVLVVTPFTVAVNVTV
jgi:hypothetical protein